MLRTLPDDWLAAHEGGETWSPHDVLGHLIHGERTDWLPRARIIMEHGEARAFEPYDRFAQFAEARAPAARHAGRLRVAAGAEPARPRGPRRSRRRISNGAGAIPTSVP